MSKRRFYKILPNPLVSLTDEHIVKVGRWLDIMKQGDVTWREARVELPNAESMINYIERQDPTLEGYIIVCPILDFKLGEK